MRRRASAVAAEYSSTPRSEIGEALSNHKVNPRRVTLVTNRRREELDTALQVTI